MLRRGDSLVVRWVDRLGRKYQDVTAVIRQLVRKGILIRTVINGLTFDGATKDPMQQAIRDALIAFMAAMVQAKAEAIKDEQAAEIAHAKAAEDGRYKGRKPSFTKDHLRAVQTMLVSGSGISTIAAETGLTRQTVCRLKGDPAAAEATLKAWRL